MSRIRANNIVNGAGTGAPTFPNGAIISGITTINADIDSNSNLTANQITSLQSIGVGTGATVTNPADNELAFNTNGSERLRIDSSGNVGIGTDNPSQNIHIIDSSQPTIRLDRSDAPRNNFVASWNADELVLASDHDNTGGASRIRFFVDSDEKVRIDDNGNIVMLNSGTGIDFSATGDGSGTTTSELLDDYEEGIFTPEITQGVTGTPTYANQLGWYTKIGRIVTVYFYIRFASSGNTGSDSIFYLGNLPFPIASTNNTALQRGMGVSNYHSIPGFTSANISFYGGGNSNTFASVYQGNNSVKTTSAVNSQWIIGGFEYISE
jgi:hypothetical protein